MRDIRFAILAKNDRMGKKTLPTSALYAAGDADTGIFPPSCPSKMASVEIQCVRCTLGFVAAPLLLRPLTSDPTEDILRPIFLATALFEFDNPEKEKERLIDRLIRLVKTRLLFLGCSVNFVLLSGWDFRKSDINSGKWSGVESSAI